MDTLINRFQHSVVNWLHSHLGLDFRSRFQPSRGHAKPIQEGILIKHRQDGVLHPWRPYWAVLYNDSTLAWYDSLSCYIPYDKIVIKNSAPYVALGTWTRRIKSQPPLPDGYNDERHLLAIGRPERGLEIEWFIIEDFNEIKKWALAITEMMWCDSSVPTDFKYLKFWDGSKPVPRPETNSNLNQAVVVENSANIVKDLTLEAQSSRTTRRARGPVGISIFSMRPMAFRRDDPARRPIRRRHRKTADVARPGPRSTPGHSPSLAQDNTERRQRSRSVESNTEYIDTAGGVTYHRTTNPSVERPGWPCSCDMQSYNIEGYAGVVNSVTSGTATNTGDATGGDYEFEMSTDFAGDIVF